MAPTQHRTGPAMTVVAVWTGAKAEAFRQAIRLSQEAFADRLGMSVRTVARWHAQPHVELRAATSNYLDTLLTGLDAPARVRFGALLDDSDGDRSELLGLITIQGVDGRGASVPG